jgi:hypothetical protein
MKDRAIGSAIAFTSIHAPNLSKDGVRARASAVAFLDEAGDQSGINGTDGF